MQEITKITEKLDELKPNWRAWYTGGDFQKTDNDQEARKLLYDLLDMVRQKEEQFIDQPDEDGKKKWRKDIRDLIGEDPVKKIIDLQGNVLAIYSDMKIVRNMGKYIYPFLEDSLYHYSVYYEASFLEQNEKYGVTDKDLFEKAVRALDTVVFTHVNGRLTRKMAKQEFEEVTGIAEPYSSFYGELYEKYYGRIQGNNCLEMLGKIYDKLDCIIGKLDNGRP